MAHLDSNRSTPSEIDDEVDDHELPMGQVWAYPCKLPSCPDYGKSWGLRSNFLFHLREREAHEASGTTAAMRRAIELEWRYATDPLLPPRAPPYFRSREDPEEHIWEYSFRDHKGRVISGRGTSREIALHRIESRWQAGPMIGKLMDAVNASNSAGDFALVAACGSTYPDIDVAKQRR